MTRTSAERLFAGPGEMRARCRALDWGTTPLGAVEGWPAALCTLAPVVLAAGFPSCLFWGPDLALIYNDAYIPLMGALHPGVLGRRHFEVVPESRAAFEPLFARVFAGETVSVADVPTTFRREALDAPPTTSLYTFSFAPVRDEGDAARPVAAIHGIVMETTGQVAQRESEARYRALFESIDEAVCLAERLPRWPDGRYDWRYLAMNPRMQSMFGIPDLTGRSMRESFPDESESWYDDFDRVLETGRPMRFERAFETQGLTLEMFVTRLEDGSGKRLLIVMQDVTARRRAQEAIRTAADHGAFRLALTDGLRGALDPMEAQSVSTRLLGDHLGVSRAMYGEADAGSADTFTNHCEYRRNSAMPTSLGQHRWDDFGAYVATELRAGRTLVVEDVRAHATHSADDLAAYESVGIRAYLAVPLVRDGRIVAYLAVNETTPRSWTTEEIALAEETAERTWAAVARARAEAALRESEARHAFLLELSDALAPLNNPNAMQAVACRMLCAHLGVQRVNYADIQGDEYVVRCSYADGVAPITGGGQIAAFTQVLFEEFQGTPVIGIDDVATDPRFDERQRASYARAQIAASANVMMTRGERWVASLAAHSATPRGWTAEELALVRETGERTWAAVERARAEAALHETQRRLDEALATARMAYWQLDPATGRAVSSPSMEALFGLRAGQRVESVAEGLALVHPDDLERHRALLTQAEARGEGWRAEYRVVRPRDGQVVWLEEVATVARDPHSGVSRVTGLVWDITDRRRSEAAEALERSTRDRNALRRQLLEAEEGERRRLARELHDEAGQHLTALGLGLQALSDLAPAGSEVDRRTAELRALVNTMGRELHGVAVRLRPRALDDFGLESALIAYVKEWSRQTSIEVDVHAQAHEVRLPGDVESVLYRVVQEALTNAARHSGATRASVVVERRDGHVVAIVEDDGRGFDADAISGAGGRVEGFGLLGMRERVELLGGRVELESAPGVGTTVFVRVPVGSPTETPAVVAGRTWAFAGRSHDGNV